MLQHWLSCYTNSWNIPHPPTVFTAHNLHCICLHWGAHCLIFTTQFPFHHTIQFPSVYQSTLYRRSFLSLQHKVICKFPPTIYLSSNFEFSKQLTAALVTYSLYNLNRIGDKQLPCLTPLPHFLSPLGTVVLNPLINVQIANHFSFAAACTSFL
jgi:hypothetical protein